MAFSFKILKTPSFSILTHLLRRFQRNEKIMTRLKKYIAELVWGFRFLAKERGAYKRFDHRGSASTPTSSNDTCNATSVTQLPIECATTRLIVTTPTPLMNRFLGVIRVIKIKFNVLFSLEDQAICSSDYDLAYCGKSCNRGDCTSSGKRDCGEGLMCCVCPMWRNRYV